MRFMMMAISRGSGVVAQGMEYNRLLRTAGVLLAFDGLYPASAAARVGYADGRATVTEGAYGESNEVCGYWIIQVRSREEAIEWAKRAPMSNGEVIEIRQIQETEAS